MNAVAESKVKMADTVKWLLFLVLLTGGIWGFYAFADQSLLLRVVGLLVVLALAAAVALQTEKGRATWSFAKDSRTEVRKVVWPSRTETLQTTGLIIALVTMVSLFLWGLDSFLGWITKSLLGG